MQLAGEIAAWVMVVFGAFFTFVGPFYIGKPREATYTPGWLVCGIIQFVMSVVILVALLEG